MITISLLKISVTFLKLSLLFVVSFLYVINTIRFSIFRFLYRYNCIISSNLQPSTLHTRTICSMFNNIVRFSHKSLIGGWDSPHSSASALWDIPRVFKYSPKTIFTPVGVLD